MGTVALLVLPFACIFLWVCTSIHLAVVESFLDLRVAGKAHVDSDVDTRMSQGHSTAETFVRSQLGLHPMVNMLVLLLAGNKAMMEVDESLEALARESMDMDGQLWKATFLDNLGFSSEDVRAFQTGSVAKR